MLIISLYGFFHAFYWFSVYLSFKISFLLLTILILLNTFESSYFYVTQMVYFFLYTAVSNKLNSCGLPLLLGIIITAYLYYLKTFLFYKHITLITDLAYNKIPIFKVESFKLESFVSNSPNHVMHVCSFHVLSLCILKKKRFCLYSTFNHACRFFYFTIFADKLNNPHSKHNLWLNDFLKLHVNTFYASYLPTTLN